MHQRGGNLDSLDMTQAELASSTESMSTDQIGEVTPEHIGAGLRWLFERYPRWNLSMWDLSILLGGVSEQCLQEWKEYVLVHDGIEVPHDTLERVSLLLGIHKALAQITPDGHEDRAYAMFVEPIDLVGLRRRSIRNFLLEDSSVESMYYVRRVLGSLMS